ncbi:anti-sigma factor antagonist [Dactylosporangium sp. CS-047395]|uniref:anti-sigma factor antagonist n=1 Tax=Dactylosporangium sp. CS-047395 TaxID=3239936 RepID=UPI003D8DE20A
MQVDVTPAGRCVVATVTGEVDAGVVEVFRAELRAIVQDAAFERGQADLVMNLSGVSFIDSSALGALVNIYKEVTLGGGSVSVVGSQPVLRLFDLTQLDSLFRMTSTVAEAVAPFLSEPS